MPSYLVLGNYTEQGMQNIREMPVRREAVKESIRDAGGRMIFWYLTLGEYDFVSVVEVPDAETAATLLLTLGTEGNVRTATMRAFTEDEASVLTASLP